MATRNVVVKTKPRRRYAKGGEVDKYGPSVSVPIPKLDPDARPPARPTPRYEAKSEPKAEPRISGGFSDALKRREDRMDAVTKGKADPGQTYARGGKVKKK